MLNFIGGMIFGYFLTPYIKIAVKIFKNAYTNYKNQ